VIFTILLPCLFFARSAGGPETSDLGAGCYRSMSADLGNPSAVMPAKAGIQ